MSEEYTPVDTGDSGWGTTFHRHFASSDIHRDDRTCERGGKRQVYVFDPDHLLAHDAEIARRAEVTAQERIIAELIGPAASLEASVRAFKSGWHRADIEGRTGERVAEGLRAVVSMRIEEAGHGE